jgi:hypothetical protein
MIGNLFRGFVEGLGSKSLANIFAAVFSVLLTVFLGKKTGLPENEVYVVVGSILALAFGFLFKQWHLDVKTDGKTTTQALLIDKLAKMAAGALPENTVAHKVADAVDAAIPDNGSVPQTPPVQK